MSSAPRVTVRAVQPVAAGLDALGFPAEEFLREAGIPPAAMSDIEGTVPHGAMPKLWDLATRHSGADSIGIQIAERAPIESFGVQAYAVLSSPTLRDGFRRICRFQRLLHDTTELVFEQHDTGGTLSHFLPGGRPVSRSPAEFIVSAWVRFGRLVTGQHWMPRKVSFAHPKPSDLAEYHRAFGTAVQFAAGKTALEVDAHVLDRANPRSDPGLLQVLERYAASLLAERPATRRSATGSGNGW